MVDKFLEQQGILSSTTKQIKRKRTKRRNQINKLPNTEEDSEIRRKKLHEEIDSWRNKRHEQIKSQLHCESHKRSLKALTIQIVEALDMITKLETTRRNILESSGEQETETIVEKCDQLIKVWRDALFENFQEKKRLEEILRVSSQELNMCRFKDSARECEQWKCLFGDSFKGLEDLRPGTFQEFVGIRSEWDAYISKDEGATKIPPWYSIPMKSEECTTAKDSLQLWSTYLEK